MNVAAATPDALERQRPIRVDEYHRMIEAGILGEDERVELIDGVLVAMTPQGRLHAFVIQELNRLLVRALADEYKVLTQLPLSLGSWSEPEPDLAVVPGRSAGRQVLALGPKHTGALKLLGEMAQQFGHYRATADYLSQVPKPERGLRPWSISAPR